MDETFGSGGIVEANGTEENVTTDALAVGDDGRSFYLRDLNREPKVVALTRSGELDRSFGQGGRVLLGDTIEALSLAVSPTGEIVVTAAVLKGVQPLIIRLTRDGQFDRTFGDEGVARVDFPGFLGEVEFDGAGRMVVVAGGWGEARLIRINDDGGVDSSFGDGGISPVSVSEDAKAFELGPDGTMFLLFDDPLRIAKYSPSGQLDQAFGDGGIAAPAEPVGILFGTGLAVDAAGRVHYARIRTGAGSLYREIQIYRLSPDGQLDPGFVAAPELVGISPEGDAMLPFDVETDAQGRVLVSGRYGYVGPDNFAPEPPSPAIARLMPDGSLDRSFGEDGISMFPLAYSDFPFPAFGELVLAGSRQVMSAGGGFISRIELDDDPADADADEVGDRKDGCPRRYARQRDGCGRLPVKVTAKRSGAEISGRVKAVPPCRQGGSKPVQLRIFAATGGGRPKLLGKAPVSAQGGWSARVPRRADEVFAAYPQHRSGDIGVCRGARSRIVARG
ncbi:MAG: hypothetical protein U0R24_06185 [Solirubrobacterales bacterium]